jgi:hypothetical protein
LAESENQQTQKHNGEIDYFSRFLFGNNKHRETYKNAENNSQELPEQKQKHNREIDYFSRFSFGNNKHRETYKNAENNSQELPEQKQKHNGEIDHFSRFLFGNNKHRETYKNSEINSQKLFEQKEQSSYDRVPNRNNDWFFGVRRKQYTPSPQTIPDQIENILNNVDLELLMETVDMFVTTTKQLKPLIKEITPFFHRFSKTFKSN